MSDPIGCPKKDSNLDEFHITTQIFKPYRFTSRQIADTSPSSRKVSLGTYKRAHKKAHRELTAALHKGRAFASSSLLSYTSQ